eukprot:7994190-Alexandrium_andersonii.AAC.1
MVPEAKACMRQWAEVANCFSRYCCDPPAQQPASTGRAPIASRSVADEWVGRLAKDSFGPLFTVPGQS